MDELEVIRKLSAAAAKLPPPQLDVTQAVMDQIRAPTPRGDGVFWVLAALSAAAAAALAVAATPAYLALNDPLALLFNPVVTVMR